jgi:hypothetical protein
MYTKYLPLFSAAVILLSGCSKKKEAATETAPAPAVEAAPEKPKAPKSSRTEAAPERLPGETDVRNALAQKDYNGAVERLMILRGIASNEQYYTAYRELAGEVGLVLGQAAQTEPKAREALAAYRVMMYGAR